MIHAMIRPMILGMIKGGSTPPPAGNNVTWMGNNVTWMGENVVWNN